MQPQWKIAQADLMRPNDYNMAWVSMVEASLAVTRSIIIEMKFRNKETDR